MLQEVRMNQVIGGVDIHADVHCAAVIDQVGRLLGVGSSGPTAIHLGNFGPGWRASVSWKPWG